MTLRLVAKACGYGVLDAALHFYNVLRYQIKRKVDHIRKRSVNFVGERTFCTNIQKEEILQIFAGTMPRNSEPTRALTKNILGWNLG